MLLIAKNGNCLVLHLSILRGAQICSVPAWVFARLTQARETNLRGAAAYGYAARWGGVGRTTGIGFLHSPSLQRGYSNATQRGQRISTSRTSRIEVFALGVQFAFRLERDLSCGPVVDPRRTLRTV